MTTTILWLALAAGGSAQAQQEPDDAIDQAVMALLDEYMEAFNATDMAAWEATFHFPHYRLASGEMSVLEGPGGRSAEALRRALGEEWHHSAWARREIIHRSPTKVHVDTRFTRYREDGSVIGSFDSLYIVTKEDGRWGVKMRSSFAR